MSGKATPAKWTCLSFDGGEHWNNACSRRSPSSFRMLAAANLPPYEHSTVAQARERMNAIAMLERPASPLAEVRDLCIPAPTATFPCVCIDPVWTRHCRR